MFLHAKVELYDVSNKKLIVNKLFYLREILKVRCPNVDLYASQIDSNSSRISGS